MNRRSPPCSTPRRGKDPASSRARRNWLLAANALALAGLAGPVRVRAQAADAGAPLPAIPVLREAVAGRPVTRARVRLELPQLAENGNSVPITVGVDAPMTEQSYVRRITLYSEKNPQPRMASFTLGPYSGRAEVVTRVRLAGTQHVVALAELSDGSLLADVVGVEVTVAACVDGS